MSPSRGLCSVAPHDLDLAIWQRVQESATVAFGHDSRIENHDDSGIALGSNQPPHTLLESQNRFGNLEVHERIAAVLALLGGRRTVPLGVKQALTAILTPSAQRYVNSSVLSNVGQVSEAMSFGDGGEATELWFSPPVRAPMSIGLGAASYRGRLHLAFRGNHYGDIELGHETQVINDILLQGVGHGNDQFFPFFADRNDHRAFRQAWRDN